MNLLEEGSTTAEVVNQ